MATTLTAMPISHPWARNDTSDPYGMAEIIATLGRINISRHVHSAPDWSIVDTIEAVSNLVDIISLEIGNQENTSDVPSHVPALYIDIQTIDDSTQRACISLLQVYVLQREHIYLVDVQTLGRQGTFDTEGSTQRETLKTILESATIPKVFFDVRVDGEILFRRYGISLDGVQDLQLMELAARAVCPTGSTSLPSPYLGSDLMKSASGLGMPGRSMSAIRRSSRSRSGSITPPVQHRYPLSPPATPTSHTISMACSPVSATSSISHASEASSASSATTVSIASNTEEATKITEHQSQNQEAHFQSPRQPRRSLRHLNNLPRCVNRDLNLSILEQITWEKWITLQKKRSQVELANRELRRLNGLLFSSALDEACEEQDMDGAMETDGEGYRLLKMDKGMDISARPLSKGSETMELIGLVVLNVRYLPGLWGEYERRLRSVSEASRQRQAGNETCGNSSKGLSREEVWRKRVDQGTRERLELAKSGQYGLMTGGIGGKGRGKLMMLAPVGWD